MVAPATHLPQRVSGAAGLIRATRIRHWWYFLPLPLLSWRPAADVVALAQLGRGVLVAGCILAFGYLVNGLSDRSLDGSAEKRLAPADTSRELHLWALGLACAAVGLAATGPLVVSSAALVALASGLLYSVGPRLKAVPVVGTLMNATHFAPLLLLGGAMDGALERPRWWVVATFCALILQSQLIHEAADARDDARGDVRTTYLAIGAGATSLLVSALGCLVLYGALGVATSLDRSAMWAAPFVVFAFGFTLPVARCAPSDPMLATTRAVQRWVGALAGLCLFALVLLAR